MFGSGCGDIAYYLFDAGEPGLEALECDLAGMERFVR